MITPRRPIYWYQGLFLQPQHFQQDNLYTESLLIPVKNYLGSYFWGVCELEVDNGALKELNFDLKKGEFVFKDGTWVSINHNAVLQPRTFKILWERLHDPFIVYIALKSLNIQGEKIDKNENTPSEVDLHKPRYDLNKENIETPDLYNREYKAQIDSLNYVLQFVWGNELDSYPGYELIPIAKVGYNGQEAFCSDEFIPPIITIRSSPKLLSYLKDTKESLHARSLTLSGYKNSRNFMGNELHPSSLNVMFALKIVSHYVPLLNHYAESPNLSPWVLYGVLRQLWGELSLFSDKIDALGKTNFGELLIPPYDHSNLGDCFKQTCLLINQLLNSLLDSMESVITLKQDGDYYKAEIPVNLLRDTNDFYLCIKTKLKLNELLENIARTIKIGSQEDMTILIKRALSGVPLVHLSEPPLGRAFKQNVNFFKLDHHNHLWANVKEHANLCILWGEISDQAEIDLFILKGKELLL